MFWQDHATWIALRCLIALVMTLLRPFLRAIVSKATCTILRLPTVCWHAVRCHMWIWQPRLPLNAPARPITYGMQHQGCANSTASCMKTLFVTTKIWHVSASPDTYSLCRHLLAVSQTAQPTTMLCPLIHPTPSAASALSATSGTQPKDSVAMTVP